MAISVRALSKSYSGVQALDNVDLVVEKGELVGFLGPNGAGKTTTMRAIVGLTVIDSGSIYWNGQPITANDRSRIGYMPQERGLYARMKVHEQITYFGRIAGLDKKVASERAHYWAERVGLSEREKSEVQDLSVGNQQRVQLAVALVHEPELLILDEPFAGLDPIAVSTLVDVMNEQVAKGTSVVFSSHQLNLVQDIASKVSILSEGKTLASGLVGDLRHGSSRRIFQVRWADQSPEWAPPEAEVLLKTPNSTRYEVPADSSPLNLVEEASRFGEIQSVSFEPPGLERVFVEMVQDSRKAKGAAQLT